MKVSQLETNNGQLGWLPKNPRQWTQTDIDRTKASIQEDTDFLEDRPLLVCPGLSGKYVVFGGNLRLTAARSLKLKEVPVVVYCLDEGGPEQDEIRETIKRRAMKDNGSFGAWDYDALANEWDDLPLQDWGVPSWKEEDVDDLTPKEDDNYSRKIEAPVYEPTGEDVPLSQCYDTTKYDALLSDIAASDLPEDVKAFLRLSASRHIVFNYTRIADFYANADADTQKLMEDSALVIIDFDAAIEKGFVKLTQDLMKQYSVENE